MNSAHATNPRRYFIKKREAYKFPLKVAFKVDPLCITLEAWHEASYRLKRRYCIFGGLYLGFGSDIVLEGGAIAGSWFRPFTL